MCLHIAQYFVISHEMQQMENNWIESDRLLLVGKMSPVNMTMYTSFEVAHEFLYWFRHIFGTLVQETRVQLY